MRYAKPVAALESVRELDNEVFPVVRPQNRKKWPCCIYSAVGGESLYGYEGKASRTSIRIDIYGKSFEEANRVYEACVAALDAEPTVVDHAQEPIFFYESEIEGGVYRLTTQVVIQ